MHSLMSIWGGKKYKNDSSVLTTLHNVDSEFGKFWEMFKKSRYYNNTIVVFTTDHAHYYETPYVKLVEKEKDYKKLFIDKIPLLIYDPTHKLPNEFNANGNTSLSLTPTILHLLGVSKVSNSFMGTSLFDQKKEHEVYVAAIGDEFFAIYDNLVYTLADLPHYFGSEKMLQQDISNILDFYELENNNRLFSSRKE